MAVLIMMNAAASAARRRHEKEMLEEVQKYLPVDMEIPSFLIPYGDVDDKIVDLGKSLEKLKDEDEKRMVVKNTLEAIIAKEKHRVEWDRWRDQSLAKLPRRMYSTPTLELLHGKNTNELYELFEANKQRLAQEIGEGNVPNSLEATHEYIKKINRLFQTNISYSYAMKDYLWKIMGEISLKPVIKDNPYYKKLIEKRGELSNIEFNVYHDFLQTHIYELWFRIGKEFSNEGHVTGAAKTLKDVAFDDLEAKFVIINTTKTNDAAIAVAKKLGFVLEPGQLIEKEDGVMYSKSDRWGLWKLFRGDKMLTKAKKINP